MPNRNKENQQKSKKLDDLRPQKTLEEMSLPPCKVCHGSVSILDDNAYICDQCSKMYRRNVNNFNFNSMKPTNNEMFVFFKNFFFFI